VSWQGVRGHDDLIRAFDEIVRCGRLAHAYLFAGPAGVGKRLFARELAKALLCEGRGEALEACDQCAACALVDAGNHPDLFLAGRPEEAVELPIEVVRELCRNLSLKPARGGRKIAILDDADDLNDESGNCFLKTLEEPPPGSVLILVGASAERQLSTIVSRCQVIRFGRLPEDLVAELLRSQGVDDEDMVRRLARLSDGSLGQAQALADPALWEFRQSLLKELAGSPVDSVELARKWTRFTEEAGKEGGVQRRRAALVLRLLIDFLHDALRVAVGDRPRRTEQEDLPLLEYLGKRVDERSLLDLLERCLEADMQIDRRAQLVLVIEALIDALGQTLNAGQAEIVR
jgi:DNA polymerase III subunit delta'